MEWGSEAPARAMMGEQMVDLLDLDAVGQAALVRSGAVAPTDLLDAVERQTHRVDPRVNAVSHEWFDQARRRLADRGSPEGAFGGVPLLLKDSLCHSAGDPHTEGMRALRDAGWRERKDCVLAARFRAAGFVFVGKTNVPELASMGTTEPAAYGPTRNPWHPEHSVGGSSGGSGAAVASRMVAVAHGTDASGSIRLPASMCGVVGLKPSRGRVPLGPDLAESMGPVGSRYTQHVLTRSVRDSAAVLDVIAGPAPGAQHHPPGEPGHFATGLDRPLGRQRVGLALETGTGVVVDPQCAGAAAAAAARLEEHGHEVVPVDLTWIEEAVDGRLAQLAVASHFGWVARWWLERAGIGEPLERVLEPYTHWLATDQQDASGLEIYDALAWLHRFEVAGAAWWQSSGLDALITPTVPVQTPRIGAVPFDHADPGALARHTGVLTAFTFWANLTGDPAISVPGTMSDAGLPLGVQVLAPFGHEQTVLGLAAQLEIGSDWFARRPTTIQD